MSQGEKAPLNKVQPIAERLRALLAPSCQRVEIAGSIRRGQLLVSDIEIVAMPRITEEPDGLWGAAAAFDHLEATIGLLDMGGRLRLRDVAVHRQDGSEELQQRNGRSYKALEFEGFPVDLFIVHDPAQWGVIFTIRTGPAEWSHRLVTDCRRLLRRVEGGYLYRSGQRWPCPEERDFFEGIGQPWVEPHERTPEKVVISPTSSQSSPRNQEPVTVHDTESAE